MEIVTLKTNITFRVTIGDQQCAFTTKCFRGERKMIHIPEPKDHVAYEVADIVIDSSNPWYTFDRVEVITVLWSNVLSVQIESNHDA